MIVDLPNTTTSQISKTLVRLREDGGVVALGRVLTLVIAAKMGAEEEAIEAANDASREHPMRVIVVVADDEKIKKDSASKLNAEIRVGGDAGASEVIILRAEGAAASDVESLVMGLLLPDAPVVTWWPSDAPEIPGDSPLGKIAHRRITDSSLAVDPQAALTGFATNYTPGDVDFAWTRLNLWRGLLAAVLDNPPYEPVIGIIVAGTTDSPSTTLLAAWLHLRLQAPTSCSYDPANDNGPGIHGVTLQRASGSIELLRDRPTIALLRQPGQPTHDITLPRRSLRDCLADELRSLEADETYGRVVTLGLPSLNHQTTNKAVR